MADETSIGTLNGIRPGSGGEIRQLEADIARKRAKVAASLTQLRRRVDDAVTWRYWARQYPLAWIAAGISLGFIIGFGGRNRRR